MNGGELIAQVLRNQGVQFLFTLCGGHISPILVGAKRQGIRVIDTRHEATAVFAADATARLTGIPGVAAVTAGPGVTNTVTAVKNAQAAQSPVVLIGGAVPTALRGRGALQDIDQLSLLKSAVKWSRAVRRVKDLVPALEEAFRRASSGVPGPAFVEAPMDLLYDEAIVREMYGASRQSRRLSQKAVNQYLNWHVNRLFSGAEGQEAGPAIEIDSPALNSGKIGKIAHALKKTERPLFIVGNQAVLDVTQVKHVATALEHIGAPVYLSGMARGLLGRDHPQHIRHKRRLALKDADFVLLAGVPADFRLNYGNLIRGRAFYGAANRSRKDLTMNRRPDIGVVGDPGAFLRTLATHFSEEPRWNPWLGQLHDRDQERNEEIRQRSHEAVGNINPLHLFRELDGHIGSDTILIADGGDFVATASYILKPPGPLSWLDPGPFGTLGVGAGFALAAKLNRPESEVWIIYGDGSAGYSLSEYDTFVRHQVPIIGLIGNDASWAQIAREQIEMLKDDVGVVLRHSDYHRVVEGFGGVGKKLDDPELIAEAFEEAKQTSANGSPTLINAILGRSDFRKGSISM
jgi:acetolactate synthase-1/2/3 large subunit